MCTGMAAAMAGYAMPTVHTDIFVAIGTGDVDSVGAGRGKFHCVNVPLKDGVRDEQYGEIFTR